MFHGPVRPGSPVPTGRAPREVCEFVDFVFGVSSFRGVREEAVCRTGEGGKGETPSGVSGERDRGRERGRGWGTSEPAPVGRPVEAGLGLWGGECNEVLEVCVSVLPAYPQSLGLWAVSVFFPLPLFLVSLPLCPPIPTFSFPPGSRGPFLRPSFPPEVAFSVSHRSGGSVYTPVSPRPSRFVPWG